MESMLGRPKLFETPQEFEELAEAYFKKNEGKKISWTGLCLAVGASSRQSLERYKRGEHGQEFVDSIKRALTVVENYYEEKEDGAKSIFALKNFGWQDKLDLGHNGAVAVGEYKMNQNMTPKEAAKAFQDEVKNA